MYKCYQVVLIAEDGEHVLSEWNQELNALNEINRIKGYYTEGQRVVLREISNHF